MGIRLQVVGLAGFSVSVEEEVDATVFLVEMECQLCPIGGSWEDIRGCEKTGGLPWQPEPCIERPMLQLSHRGWSSYQTCRFLESAFPTLEESRSSET